MRRALSIAVGLAGLFGAMSSCAGRLPEPQALDQPGSAFQAVPYPPPPGKVEYVPARPSSRALWTSGQWRWTGGEWIWEHGGWFDVPDGIRFARWATKRDATGILLFAPSSWRDARGVEVPRPTLLARAAAGPETMATDESEAAEGDLHEAGLADAPTIFDGPLFDAMAVRQPVIAERALLEDGGPDGHVAEPSEAAAPDASDGATE